MPIASKTSPLSRFTSAPLLLITTTTTIAIIHSSVTSSPIARAYQRTNQPNKKRLYGQKAKQRQIGLSFLFFHFYRGTVRFSVPL